MIDWKLAGQVARGVSNLQPAGDPEPFRRLDGPAAESERLVRAYTGLSAEQLPVPEAVDRAGWIDANLVSLEAVLEPAARRLAGGLVAFTAYEDPLAAPLDLEPHSPVIAARTATGLAEVARVPSSGG